MGIIGMILGIIQLVPGLLKAVQAILDFIRQVHKTDPAKAQLMLQQLKAAAKAAKAGDPKPMQVLADSVAKHCEGPYCTSDED